MTVPGNKRCTGRGASVWIVAGVALLAGACGGSDRSGTPEAALSPSPAPATTAPGRSAPSLDPGGAGQTPVPASPGETVPAAAPAPGAAGLTKTVAFGSITFYVPQEWNIDVDGDTAYVGVLAGGPEDVMLRVQRNFSGPIDALKPSSCPRQGDAPERADSVVTADQGLRPVGDRKAEYRLWKVTCPTGGVKEHRAWLLPTSKIAIYEQVYDPRNAAVVANARVR